MAIARAFTTKRSKQDIEISTPMHITRAASQRGGRPVVRGQISTPLALISTSNMHIHDAQSISGTSPIEIRNVSASSGISNSSDESDTSNSSVHSAETATDASSVDDMPIKAEPQPNHLSAYFKPAVDTVHSRAASESSQNALERTPTLPQRVPSHSKRAHERLHRKRSIQRMLSPPPSRDGNRDVARSSTEIFSPARTAFVEAPIEKENPFGKELAQLEQVAEEFGQVVRDAKVDADTVYMESHGLGFFSASDYMFEIQGLILDMFADERSPVRDFAGFF